MLFRTTGTYSGGMTERTDPAHRSKPQESLSLEQLSQLYAQTLRSHSSPGGSAPDAAAPPEQADALREEGAAADERENHGGALQELPAREPGSEAARDSQLAEVSDETPEPDPGAACPITPASLLEAMLFVGDRNNTPLSATKAAALMRGVEPEEIPELVSQLNRRYASRGCPYRVVGREGGYCLVLHPRFEAVRTRLYGRIRDARLSQAAIDVLAIVAYRQPITAEEVSRLRGTSSGHLLNLLVQRRLLQTEAPAGKHRPLKYRTTKRFLELFGLDRPADLPETEDIDKR